MRLLVYGPGGVGGTLAVALSESGQDVQLVARGAHAQAIASIGLQLRTPTREVTAPLRVAESAKDIDLTRADAILLCVKSQDTAAALEDLIQSRATNLPLVCVQNGVLNERLTAPSFDRVYGMMVWMPACHLEPGVVEVYSEHPMAALRIGRFRGEVDELCDELASALTKAGCDTATVANIDAWKHGKLLRNLGNGLDAFCKTYERSHPFCRALVAEAEAVLRTLRIDFISKEELLAATDSVVTCAVAGEERRGGSTWQSAQRSLPNEVEFLNGYICQLGASCGIATPANRALVELALSQPAPRSVDIAALSRAL